MIVPLERCLAGYREQRVSRMLGGGKRKIDYPFTIVGIRNFHVAENVGIGPGSTIYCTSAKITIDRHFMAGPNLTIMTGDHDWQVGRFIDSIGEKEKNPERDGDVHIEQDVWIGANVTILKGVTIGESSIVGARSVVTKNVPAC